MKRFLLAVSVAMVGALSAQAENTPVVVELFTSQGCSSCPPADEMMDVLADRDDVIALSLHVDYWDYIGWKDEFADPRHAERQRAYAALAGRRSVYTPEMIVNGESDIVGAKPMELAMAIEKHKAEQRQVAVEISAVSGTAVEITANPLVPDLGRMQIVLVRYQPERVARITRGENAGRTIEYRNVVDGWAVVGTWDGRASVILSADIKAGQPVVVLVQAEGYGPIRGAARLKHVGN